MDHGVAAVKKRYTNGRAPPFFDQPFQNFTAIEHPVAGGVPLALSGSRRYISRAFPT
jgi:hypothetical protein